MKSSLFRYLSKKVCLKQTISRKDINNNGFKIFLGILLVVSLIPPFAFAEEEKSDSLSESSETTAEFVMPEGEPGVDYVENELIVMFHDFVSDEEAERFLFNSGVSINRNLTSSREGLPSSFVVESSNLEESINVIAKNSSVKFVQPNFASAIPTEYTETPIESSHGLSEEAVAPSSFDALALEAYYPNDPYTRPGYPNWQWHLESINAFKAWGALRSAGFGNSDVTVAVFDSDFEPDHPDLQENVVGTWRASTGESDVSGISGHGAAVAGLISARMDNAEGIAGVANNSGLYLCDIALYKGSPYVHPDRVLSAVGHLLGVSENEDRSLAEKLNIRVANMSFGSDICTPADREILKLLNDAGILCVAAAGNENTMKAHYPSDLDDCIGVIGLAKNGDRRDTISNYGDLKDISAHIGGTTTMSVGEQARYVNMSGTSTAAPLVSGVAALLFQVNPGLDVYQAKAILCSTAVDLGEPGKDIEFGYGKVDAYGAVLQAMSEDYECLEVSSKRFPDSVFRNYILEYVDADRNGFLNREEIASCTKLDIARLGIEDLYGIKHFKFLQELDCSSNNLNELDLSMNKNLIKVDCSNNKLLSINVEENTNFNELVTHSQNIEVLVRSETGVAGFYNSFNKYPLKPEAVISIEGGDEVSRYDSGFQFFQTKKNGSFSICDRDRQLRNIGYPSLHL